MDALRRHAEPDQRSLALLDQPAGTAQKGVVDLVRRRERSDQRVDLLRVDAAVEQRQFLLLAGEHVVHGEAFEIAVLQVLECVLEDDAPANCGCRKAA